MRKFFSIALYVIAGLFSVSILGIAYSSTSEVNLFVTDISYIETVTLFVLLTIAMLFFLLASLLYPSRDYNKPVYMTLLTSIIIVFLSEVNQYFVMQGFKNSDINASIAEVFKENAFSNNLPLGVSVSIVFLLMALYFYIQSRNLDAKDEKLLIRKRWSPFFISFTIVFFLIYVSSKLFISNNTYADLNATAYTNLIQEKVDKNESVELIAILSSKGYDNYLDDEDKFIFYNNAIMELFNKNTWKRKSIVLKTKLWANMLHENNLTQNKFDAFFEQLEELDTSEEDKNTTWGILSKKLPEKYLNYMDIQLENILSSNLEVPLVKLYKKDGTTVEEMGLSRAYLVSEVYRRMSDFCDDASTVLCDAEEYAKKASQSCSLNPSALFLYAYQTDNSKLVIDLLEDVLALTKGSDELLENDKFAVYNNLGYNIYLDSQEDKYDDALHYLKKAYALNNEAVYSLSSISGIYREKKDYKSAYDVMEYETYKFLHTSNKDLLEKETNYWIFVKSIIETSYAFKDYNTVKYACDKYLELYDSEYEDCHDYLKEIKELPNNSSTKPIYSFWKLYIEPEIYNAVKVNKEVKGTLECGSVMTYANSLKYKSTSRKQTKLLEKFTTLYNPFKVPPTLKELIKIEERLGADSYVISFYLDPEDREKFFQGTFSYEDEALNKKVSKYFFPLSHIDGTGANAALWAIDGNDTDLENAPIIEFGSEGQIDIVAKNLKDFIYMLSFGIEPMDGRYSQFVSINEENYRRENFIAYRKWLKETMKIEPVKDLKVWGTPKKIEIMEEEAQALYRNKLFQWLYTLIPNHGTVEKGKQEADKFIVLAKEKKRLQAMIDENITSEVYLLLAQNEQGLRDIDRSVRKNVTAYYKKAYELEHNDSIIEKWAMFMSNFSNNKNKANLYIRFSEIYNDLGKKDKAKEYLTLGLDLYKSSVENEVDTEKKMRFYENIAEIYKETNQSNNAIDYYKKALAIKVEDKLWLKKYYYVDLAKIYEEQKEYLLAIENYKKAVSIVKKDKDKALYNYHIADNFKALSNLEKALYYARKSLILAPENTVLKENCLVLIDNIKSTSNK